MAGKQIRLSRRMLFTLFMLGGFILLLAPQGWTNNFQFAFARIFSWPLSISRNISLSVRAHQLPIDVVSRREYNQLQNHLANLTEQLQQQRDKVESLYGLRSRFALEGVKFVLADVITDSISGRGSELIINRGQDDGLIKGQFVLGDNSVIGTIADVSARTAQVRLINDPKSNMAVKITGLDIGRMMQGDGKDAAKILMLSIKHKIELGSAVYACKVPGLLDTPMIAARVSGCTRDDENPSLWDITARPVCDIERLNDVAVLIMNPQQ